MAGTPTTPILFYPALPNITFVLRQVRRMSKADEEAVSDQWENDFLDQEAVPEITDLPVHARLMFRNGNAFLNAHRGSSQILLSPLYLIAEEPQGRTVNLHLRDYSNRTNRLEGGLNPNNQCYRRLFKFDFQTRFEAVAFSQCHNLFLRAQEETEDKEEAPPPPPSPLPSPPGPSEASSSSHSVLDTTMNTVVSVGEVEVEEGAATAQIDEAAHREIEERDARRAVFDAPDETTQLDDMFDNTQQQEYRDY